MISPTQVPRPTTARSASLGTAAALCLTLALPGQTRSVVSGAAGGDQFGTSVARVADLDGDTCDELIVGAPETGSFGAGPGSARVYSGRTRTLLFALQGEAVGDRFGTAVAGLGDLDGDGFAELLVGAPRAGTATTPDTGACYVFSGRDGSLLFRLLGEAAGDRFGQAVADAGDVDSDGYGDLLVGAPGSDVSGAESGCAQVWSGRSRSVLRTVSGFRAGDRLGAAVAGAGDVDGDERPDLLIGIPGASIRAAGAGSAILISGANGTVLWIGDGGETSGQYGAAVSGAGDLDGDGLADVVIGEPFGAGGKGLAHLVTGIATAPTPAVVSAEGLFANQNLGASVTFLRDADGNGRAEIAVGSPGPVVLPDRGCACVLSLDPAGDLVLEWAPESQDPTGRDRFGASVAGGDWDGDGIDDLAIGGPAAPNGTAPGQVTLLDLDPLRRQPARGGIEDYARFGSGLAGVGDVDRDGFGDIAVAERSEFRSQTFIKFWSGSNPFPVGSFGFGLVPRTVSPALAATGDLDGDGVRELLVGVPQLDSSSTGSVFVLRGATGQQLRRLVGPDPMADDRFGIDVANAGDVNGDGIDDALIGSDPIALAPARTGYARVVSGADGRTLFTFSGDTVEDRFGVAVAGLGDLDADGRPDLAVVAAGSATRPGYLRLFSGRDGRVLDQLPGNLPGEGLAEVSALGDVDGDGIGDFAVGTVLEQRGGTAVGSARVFSGADRRLLWELFGATDGDRYGAVIAGGADLTGDGVPDFVVAAPGAFDGGRDGYVELRSGGDGALIRTFRGEDSSGEGFGGAVAIAPDLNRDGRPDLAVGSIVGGVQPYFGRVATYHSLARLARAIPYGAGCPTSGGRLPQIGVSARPALGSEVDLRLRDGPAFQSAFLLLLGYRSPRIELAPIGMPGCALLGTTDLGIQLVATDGTGAAAYRLQIPGLPELAGSTFFAQWLIRDRFANRRGFVTSSGLEVRVDV
ncbi:MAG: FG-GAP repeat protein [Planctomycetes bacterium]|nr:FG-GAP repeat protein [Planctomycetota bacterium]